jgi:M6 family metalloprotease-like protein
MKKTICPPQICGSALLLTVLVLSSTVGFSQTNSRKTESPSAVHMRGLNNTLLRLHGQMQQAGPNDVRQLRSQAAMVIAQRSAALTNLIENEPHAALTFAFSPELLADLAAKFPQSASRLESHTAVSGPVERWTVDYPGLKSSRTWLTMRLGETKLNLHFAYQEPPNLKSGDVVQATGVVVGSEMAVETSATVQSNAALTSTSAPSSMARLAASNSTSERRWLMFALSLCGIVFAVPPLGVNLHQIRKHVAALLKRSAIYGIAFAVFVSSSTATFAQTSSCSTTGVQNVAVLLVTFPGATMPAGVTPQSLSDIFFGTTGRSLDGFLREASYGQASATGNVFGPYTLTGSYSSCGDVGGAVLTDAITAAIANGVNLNNYSRVFLVFPNIFNCFWAGYANVGGCSIYYSPTQSFFNASIAYLVADATSDRDMGVEYASHEMGHNFGLLHSGIITTSTGTDVLGPVGSPGTFWDQGGDYWSTMGELALGLYPSPQRAEVLKWMTPTNYQIVQGSGTYTLQPLESSPPGLEALKVQRGTGNNEWLWVEYRQALGNYDSTLFPQPFSGALIHYEDSNTQLGHTYLPNFTPTDLSWNSPALAAGQTWTDPYTNVSVSVVSATPSGLAVNVKYGAQPAPTCTQANPTLTVTPLNPSIYPGNSASYALSVASNDSSGCSANTFKLSSTQPSAWPTSFSATAVTLNPGQSASLTMYKTGPSGTPPGTYAVNATAANNSYVGAATANVTVMTAPALAVSIAVSGSSFVARSTIPITATVLNSGTPASGASVTFTLTAPDGSTATQSATTSSTGTAMWSYKLGPRSLSGTYSVVAQAALSSSSKRATSTQTATSNTVSFAVQ